MRRFLALLMVTGCGVSDYAQAPPGEFTGSVFVMWVGETQHGAGDGTFVFVPTDDPLTFRRNRPSATLPVVRPQMMYTDGGSIPQFAQVFNGLSPWSYAPAYMVHDWLFVARKCLNDGMANPAEQAVAAMDFDESADIAEEAIRTLVESGKVRPNDVAARAITSAVAGPITRLLWHETGACRDPRIKPEHLQMIRRALPGVAGLRALRDGGPKAEIVQIVQF